MSDFALNVQQLPAGTDRVLVIGQLVGSQEGDGWFTPRGVVEAFEAFRLPPLSNVSQTLTQLRNRQLVVRRASGGQWSLTPLGRRHVVTLMGTLDESAAEATRAQPVGAELFHGVHMLIPPFFAPARWADGIRRFLERFPFDTNVFCMTRFPRTGGQEDPLAATIERIRGALAEHSLVLHLASDQSIVDDLWGNVAAHGWACRYGIGLFEDRVSRGLNYNLVAEIGAMLMTGRRCALLKDLSQEGMPTDFAGHLYKAVDFGDLEAVEREVHQWVTRDLGLG